jgi:hypothetical protein
MQEKEVWSLEEARRFLGFGSRKAKELAQAGEFPGQLPKMGRAYRISRRQVIAYLESATPSDGAA